MRARLHTDLRMAGNTLLDSTLGLRYSLSPDAAWLVGQLMQEEQVDHLVVAVSRLRQLPKAEARQAVYSLLGQLAAFGGVIIKWPPVYVANTWRPRLLWRLRQDASAMGFARAAWRAYGSLFVPLEALAALAYIVTDRMFPLFAFSLPALLIASFVVHEAGHCLTARAIGVPVVLLSRPGYMALLYKRPMRRAAAWIACAGPLLTALICVSVALFAPSGIARWVALGIALAHILNLLPIFADGRTLWRCS